jgi:molybdopterin converting factor small subunit
VIKIEARLYATLGKYHPEGKVGEALARELAEGTTVQKLLENELGVPPDEVKTVFVNGVSRSFDHVLADGDRVGIFPPVGGG